MVVKIRLSRFGKKRQPFYNIVVSQARTARDSKPMEVLGTYDPTPRVPTATDAPEVIDEVTGLPRKPKRYKDIQLDQSRTKYWLGVGAQPSEPVERILCLIGLMEPRPGVTKKAIPPPPLSAVSVAKVHTKS
ncbi:hypothetical protein GJ744_008806 [Endocarpon pusillum]|uniref:Ribosomal protein S16 n=1 Tax=Endocarpon pusillum TaxID=364733 RepID=A0A8H7ASH8_9EURO|nr:hypothetical protein GJ744_008806 [Endocarpon pusillum]